MNGININSNSQHLGKNLSIHKLNFNKIINCNNLVSIHKPLINLYPF